MKSDICRIEFDSKKTLVLRTDLDYFQDHFIGKRLIENWNPPDINVLGKSKKLKDVISWMHKAPVLSERAKDILAPLISPYAEFLPLIVLYGNNYYALNVVNLVECLDYERSEILFAPDEPSRILSISRTYFIENKLDTSPIFKISEWPSYVFVRRSFMDKVLENHLTGFIFVEPQIDPLESLILNH